jgi:hypothetical protein
MKPHHPASRHTTHRGDGRQCRHRRRANGHLPAHGAGGWQIIGRTDARLFDVQREPPALAAGDVVFRAVDEYGKPLA